MKNFEQHIDQVAKDWADGNAPCFIVDFTGGQCPNVQTPCTECFKKWALQEALGNAQQQDQPDGAPKGKEKQDGL